MKIVNQQLGELDVYIISHQQKGWERNMKEWQGWGYVIRDQLLNYEPFPLQVINVNCTNKAYCNSS
jgi:hypothetical protein